jgi:hypothetical protein
MARSTAAGGDVVYNVEDDQNERRRRLSVVLRQFGATPRDICGRVVQVRPASVGTLLHRNAISGKIAPTPAMGRLRDLIAERRPDMLIADPHSAEENDSTALKAVIAEFRALAVEFGLAVVLVHHTRKGSIAPGDPDSARGASATIGAARIVLTLISMSEDDAQAFGLPKDRKSRSRFVRLDDAEQNYARVDNVVSCKQRRCGSLASASHSSLSRSRCGREQRRRIHPVSNTAGIGLDAWCAGMDEPDDSGGHDSRLILRRRRPEGAGMLTKRTKPWNPPRRRRYRTPRQIANH